MSYPWSSEIDEFLALLLGSRLLEAKDIREACESIEFNPTTEDMLEKLSAHLVSSGLITQWQCDKLRAGKYRGFFLGDYKILDHVTRDYSTSTFLAQCMTSGKQVGLRVTPPTQSKPTTQYEVVDIPSG